jgi:hypothetical protein
MILQNPNERRAQMSGSGSAVPSALVLEASRLRAAYTQASSLMHVHAHKARFFTHRESSLRH